MIYNSINPLWIHVSVWKSTHRIRGFHDWLIIVRKNSLRVEIRNPDMDETKNEIQTNDGTFLLVNEERQNVPCTLGFGLRLRECKETRQFTWAVTCHFFLQMISCVCYKIATVFVLPLMIPTFASRCLCRYFGRGRDFVYIEVYTRSCFWNLHNRFIWEKKYETSEKVLINKFSGPTAISH